VLPLQASLLLQQQLMLQASQQQQQLVLQASTGQQLQQANPPQSLQAQQPAQPQQLLSNSLMLLQPLLYLQQQQQAQQQQQQVQPQPQVLQPPSLLSLAPGRVAMHQQPSLYQAALARGRAIMAHNWQAATNKQRDTAWAEFDSWSWAQLGKPGVFCTPDDLVVYLESSYLRQHGRQTAADGSSCPAPGTLASAVAHLSTRLQELGCRGPWDWVTCRGNPCNSMEVKTFKGGYANEMQEQGFAPTAAKPISEAKLQQLVQQLVQEATTAQQQRNQPWHVAALLWRDACITQYLWDSKRRPAELSSLQTAHVEVYSSAAGGSRVLAGPQVSKMCHASRGSRRPKTVDVQGEAGQQLSQLLLQYMQCLQQHGKSLGRFLFSPLQPNRQALQTEQGLSTAAMSQRVVGHLQRLGLYDGESLYSIKRGAMQHDYFIAGKSLQAIGTAADIDTLAVVQRYVDPTGHL
jgi:hypothetical protein